MQLLWDHDQDGAARVGNGHDAVAPIGGAPDVQLLIMEVADHRCALLASVVIELHQMVATVPLPNAVPTVDGVIDLRGELVVVLDLCARLGFPSRPPRASDHLAVVRLAERTVALRIDRAGDLAMVERSEIDAVTALPGEGWLKGAARLAEGLVLIYDVDTFLSAEDALAVDAAMRQLRGTSE